MALSTTQQQQLVTALTQTGYNQIDAENEARGPRAEELAIERGIIAKPAAAPKSAQQIVDDIIKSQEEQIKREMGFLDKYTADNPFIFDEQLAKESAKAEYDPYYSEQIDRYLEDVGVSRDTLQSEEKLLGALNNASQGSAGKSARMYTRAVENAKQGMAEKGSFYSGAGKRALGEAEVERNQQVDEQATDITRRYTDVNRENEAAVEGGVLQRQSEAQKQYYTPLMQSYYRQFPTTQGSALKGYVPDDYMRL